MFLKHKTRVRKLRVRVVSQTSRMPLPTLYMRPCQSKSWFVGTRRNWELLLAVQETPGMMLMLI